MPPIGHPDDHGFRLASVPVTAERMDVEPWPVAAVRTGLPPGATVADLVAALTASRPVRDLRPAPDRRPVPALRAAPAPVVPSQDRPPGAEPPRHPAACAGPPAPPRLRPPASPASRRPSPPPPPPDPPLVLFTHQDPSHELDHGVLPARTRPPIGDDLSLFGLSRRSRSRVGSRVFALSFALVFGLIFVQMVFSILYP
jgi:hypothetical protein